MKLFHLDGSGVPTHSRHIATDDQIAFRQLQRLRLPHLSREQSTDLFQVWRDHYRARQVIDEAERAARFDELCDERELLFSTRERFPEHSAEMTARLLEIGTELADLMSKFPAAPLGEWVSDPNLGPLADR